MPPRACAPGGICVFDGIVDGNIDGIIGGIVNGMSGGISVVAMSCLNCLELMLYLI
ncbi:MULTISPECIES: hypothetical protein [unclassified Janthinobacterium]|uniref:hypothetical protein n=1 Tax=unclassified Janthinobacterium TaxID=2610881 RepID=UPI002589D7E6|nr:MULTISPECIES: hypothetical protein [unclassified Janthinobacterium]MCX7292144.1 hypothetical protein [Janthinobacterium sp.]MED5593699.1 hypothetical protein [Janthinobacterium sp. P210006]